MQHLSLPWSDSPRACVLPSVPKGLASRWSVRCGSKPTFSQGHHPSSSSLMAFAQPQPIAVLDQAWEWLVQRLPGRQMTPATAARRIIRGIEREQFLVYTHSWARFIVVLRAVAPQTFSRLWDRVNAIDEARRRAAAQG